MHLFAARIGAAYGNLEGKRRVGERLTLSTGNGLTGRGKKVGVDR